jgi:predicted nucleic acid-binding Zn ribbon protein
MERHCPDCGIPVSGRKDRRFCSDACRTNYHNLRLRNKLPLVRKVNTILLRNRNILESFCNQGKTILSRYELEASGYILFWHTAKGNSSGIPLVSLVYDYSLEELTDNRFEIHQLDWLRDSLHVFPE